MTHLIDKDAILAEIDRIENGLMDAQGNFAYREDEGAYHTLCSLENFINSLEEKEVDLGLITGWFDHIAQIADDRMTLTNQRMTDAHALDEIKCLAKNSSEFITKHYKAQKGE